MRVMRYDYVNLNNDNSNIIEKYKKVVIDNNKPFYQNIYTGECYWQMSKSFQKLFNQESQIRISSIGTDFKFEKNEYLLFKSFCEQFEICTTDIKKQLQTSSFIKAFGDKADNFFSKYEKEVKMNEYKKLVKVISEIFDYGKKENLDCVLNIDELRLLLNHNNLQIDEKKTRIIFNNILINQFLINIANNDAVQTEHKIIDEIGTDMVLNNSIDNLDDLFKLLSRNLLLYSKKQIFVVSPSTFFLKCLKIDIKEEQRIKLFIEREIIDSKENNDILKQIQKSKYNIVACTVVYYLRILQLYEF